MTADINVNWGINGEPVATTPTTWEVAGKYILKLVNTQNSALSNIRLTAALHTHGVPVPHILKAIDGRDFIVAEEGCYLLMEKLAGVHIKDVFKQDYAAIAYETGIIAAKIHSALMTVTNKRTDLTFFNEELQGWVSSGLSDSILLTKEEWSGPIEALCCIYPRLPKQQIHRDLHYGNLLFEGTTLTGVLDFDLGKQDARLFDIAYFLLGQLSGQKDLMAIKDKWLIFISQFLDGYETIIVLEEEEKNALPLMMQCIELLFVVFWQQQENQETAQETVGIYKFIGICQALNQSPEV
ncbi:phosphotransferase [Lacrimispora sp. 38-1]|uniref:phosphotransferase n=1 Tax=Lacrimispora sp. 38-1 TaxID=3125778 RepID=UPI003CF73840